uniref:Predicted GPI-anchored protein 58 isoform X2 n=1 Tax=Geotrypetes seraphini TaxID=260995 RepID=A0A6P8RGZ9_GEOSA|nr:predicted GPI-anchored protein 58 isoform X2 [Geotrypetes seraphini]
MKAETTKGPSSDTQAPSCALARPSSPAGTAPASHDPSSAIASPASRPSPASPSQPRASAQDIPASRAGPASPSHAPSTDADSPASRAGTPWTGLAFPSSSSEEMEQEVECHQLPPPSSPPSPPPPPQQPVWLLWGSSNACMPSRLSTLRGWRHVGRQGYRSWPG